MTYNTPILFLVFNRPDTTQVVFNRIREVQPARLYIAADAPREGRDDEKLRCKEVKEIVSKVDWPCEVRHLYRDKNLGCKIAISSAISWFFEQEEQGIILEDDCLPDLSFFPFCEELLERYKDDQRIGHIGGNCFLPGIVKNGWSYDFCNITHIWGWATWRRVWKNMDVNFPFWEKYPERRKSLFCNKWEEIYFNSFIPDALYHRHGLNPWGVFYYYMLRTQHQLSIYPSVNLVTNIGLGDPNATHTTKNAHKLFVPSTPIHFPLKHPEYIMCNREIDRKAVRNNFFSYKRLMRYIIEQL
ncbi:hypothetical protein B5F77_01525 [Parabacteroides sp. An277]|uniref:hypothetical protein n=1 Tax=Parabacteroides sp. An277 TaxID=1965619 RepID=UPI000B38903E|nr:hypothetical protein [Parabacteroides sp. An277]OUO55560.1 hypothetical protein B5F77_01525 [Parabacteroides sp. An277]